MTALLSANAGKTEQVALYVAEARTMGVPVLAPEINASYWDFSIEDIEVAGEGGSSKQIKPHIRFGLGAIKNAGQAAVQSIIDAREANGKFADLNDFARRVDLRSVGKRALECLIKVGAMDCFGNRAALLASLDRIVAISSNHFRASEAGQMSLFGGATGVTETITLPEVNNVDRREMLNWERELIGLYISDHPLTPYQQTFTQIVSYFSGQLHNAQHEEKVRVAGLVTAVRPYTTKTNKPMGFVSIEDVQGNIELVLFPRTWAQYKEQMKVGQIIIVEGKADTGSTPPKILVDTIRTEITILEPLDAAPPPQPTFDFFDEPPAVPDDSEVSDFSYKSTQPKPTTPEQKNVPAPVTPQQAKPQPKPVSQPPARQAAETPAPIYAAKPPAEDSWDNSDVPPPPDNFPDDWDTQWQPSFEEATLAARPEPRVEIKPVSASPRQPEVAPVQIKREESKPVDIPREPLAVQTIKIEHTRVQVPPSIYVPLAKEEKDKDHPPQQITMIVRSTGDKDHDRRRIKTIFGTLISFHGKDRFSFQIFENGSGYLIDFPNDTTRVCPEMLERLKKLTGEESWRVEEITFQ
jgi:DNA polymerase-3 subunit alpha